MSTYYVDSIAGRPENDGLTPQSAISDSSLLTNQSKGDIVLFKRGSFFRQKLETREGVTYAAYGDGEPPTFCGSTDVSSEQDWIPTSVENIWECIKPIPGDVGNLILNRNGSTEYGVFRWTQDELRDENDFWDSRYGEQVVHTPPVPQKVLFCCKDNPARVFSHIEAVSYNNRILGALRSNTVFEGLRFINSGVHALAGNGENIVVRNCSFENIGGCAWSPKLRIRFGNGVELWTLGNNVTVEGCTFKSIYDSCVTHQGPGADTVTAINFVCRNNVFDTYGMAAFEYRDKLPINSSFTDNVCLNAGCGFAMLGEGEPRQSEIWPQPMGHHIFLWRIDAADAESCIEIKNNFFGKAPVGAAIYSIICPQAEQRIELDNNVYTPNDNLLIHFGGESFTSLEEYQSKTGKDKHSKYQ